MATRFALGSEFPREGFGQSALERYFAGCEPQSVGYADYACIDKKGRRWLIEAKGETADVGLDSRTGQRERTPLWVRQALGLHWFVGSPDYGLTVQAPENPNDERPSSRVNL